MHRQTGQQTNRCSKCKAVLGSASHLCGWLVKMQVLNTERLKCALLQQKMPRGKQCTSVAEQNMGKAPMSPIWWSGLCWSEEDGPHFSLLITVHHWKFLDFASSDGISSSFASLLNIQPSLGVPCHCLHKSWTCN